MALKPTDLWPLCPDDTKLLVFLVIFWVGYVAIGLL